MAETRKEKKERAMATYASLWRAVRALDELLDSQCVNLGVSPSQFRVLEHLFLNGPMATGELADGTTFGDSTVSVVTKNLEREGLLERRGDKTDKRKAIVQLTDEGRELIEDILPKRASVLRAEMCVLGKREQENLDRMCQKLEEGDPVKFVQELMLADPEEEDS